MCPVRCVTYVSGRSESMFNLSEWKSPERTSSTSRTNALRYIWMFLALLASVAPAWASVTFTDTFSPPSVLWSNTTGNWTATAGEYYAQIPNNNPGAVTLLPFDLTSYTLTTTVNNVGDGGIVVRDAGSQSITLVLGGLGYGQGVRSGGAGTAIYWGDNSNSVQNEVLGVFSPWQYVYDYGHRGWRHVLRLYRRFLNACDHPHRFHCRV